MNVFLKKLKMISLKDCFHILLFVMAIFPAHFLKKKRPKMWLVCEYGKEARDNGYWFYKYMCEKHPEQDVVYAIEKDCRDYKKVAHLGEIVPYGSLKHWIYYLAADVNISSHKGGKPNAAVCYFLEVYGLLKNKRVFLQHGITKDKTDIFIYPNTKFRLFICGAKPEYEFVKDTFGYPEGYVQYTGFARFDNLLKETEQKKQILVAPTWRSWLRSGGSDPYKTGANKHIEESGYYQAWKSFLSSEELHALLSQYGYTLVFYPHRNVQECFRNIAVKSPDIIIADFQKYDLQVLMKESAVMITDYSSSVMDFAYMEKPVLYYQFDFEEFRQKHFSEGYYNYKRDGFGPVCSSEVEMFGAVKECLEKACQMKEEYLQRVENFFLFRDMNNCERIYEEVSKL